MPRGLARSDGELADRLAARTLELVDIPSESRDEDRLAAHVLEVLRDGGVPVRHAGDTCVLADLHAAEGAPTVVLAGHLDTVPAQDNRPGRIGDGAVHGLGASDMLGAVAVIVELLLALAGEDAPPARLGVTGCLFGREELPAAESALMPLLGREPGLRAADLAVVMEPTDNALQAGCLGNINATWTFRGRTGHAARPWNADNAIVRAARGIARLADATPPRRVEVEGLEYAEVVSVTRIDAGIAGNVIPGEARCHVNHRYPPGMSPEEAAARLAAWCDEPGSELDVFSNAPSGPVATGHPLARELAAAGDLRVEPKQAWTPVAEFAAAGVAAVNFGPGDPGQAHAREEHVRIEALVRSFRVLERFLLGDA